MRVPAKQLCSLHTLTSQCFMEGHFLHARYRCNTACLLWAAQTHSFSHVVQQAFLSFLILSWLLILTYNLRIHWETSDDRLDKSFQIYRWLWLHLASLILSCLQCLGRIFTGLFGWHASSLETCQVLKLLISGSKGPKVPNLIAKSCAYASVDHELVYAGLSGIVSNSVVSAKYSTRKTSLLATSRPQGCYLAPW